MTADGRIRLARMGYLLVLAISVLICARHAVGFFAAAPAYIGYTYELNYTEGSVLCQIRDLALGVPLYGRVGERPYTFTIYPPLYHVVTAALATHVGDPVLAGRSLSFACTILIAVVIAGIVYRLGAETPAPLRWAATVIASLSFLAVEHVFAAATMMRVDMLALSLSTCGLYVFLRASSARAHAIALVLFTLALMTKHSVMAAPAACILGTATAGPRAGVKLGLAFVALVALAVGLLALVFGDAMYFHVFAANVLPYDPLRVARGVKWLVLDYPGLVAGGIAGFVYLLMAALSLTRERRSTAANWVLVAYFVLAGMSVLALGRAGTSPNHLIEVTVALCTFTGLAVLRTGQALWPRTPPPWTLARAALAMAVLIALVWQAKRQMSVDRSAMPDYDQSALARNEALLDRIRAVDGPVFGVTQFLVCRAGKPAQINTFMAAQLAMLGRWDARPLLEDVRRHVFALVFLNFDLMAGRYNSERFTPELIAALRANYRLDERIGAYHLYRPAR